MHISGKPKLFINGHQCRVDIIERFWKNVDKDGPILYEELGACWRWKGGFVTNYGSGWDSIKKGVLKRANGICERCKKSPARDVHHIIPFRCFEKHIEANVVSNLKALCVKCHQIEEEIISNSMPLLSGMRYPQTSFYGLLQAMYSASGKRETAAHRISWIIHFGQIPDKMFICHKCNNHECTNPNHLYVGTVQDNNDDIFRRRRSGEKEVKNGKLWCKDAVEIRTKLSNGSIPKQLAEEYGVSRSTIYDISNRKTFSYV
jgi:5-methylcytosine-specific restriction endonuclease McrA